MQRKVDNRGMREINRTVVLDIIRQSDRISRTDLARRTSLTKPTVSAIVEELMRDGVVHEVGFSETAASGGRPARLLELNRQSAAYIGLQFGVRTTMLAVADARGMIRAMAERPAVLRSPEKSLAAIAPLMEEALAAANVPRERVLSVGVATPGPIEQATGICVVSPNLGWHNVPLLASLQQIFKLPVSMHNEAHAAALAEGRVGVAQGIGSFVWLDVGVGIGSGIVVDGDLFAGSRGFSGEIGHCPVEERGRVCGCGRRGCLETVASGAALARVARAAAGKGEPTALKTWPRPLDAEAVIAAAREGDRAARRIVADTAEHLGKGISYLLNILDPEMIVVGGVMADAGDALFEALDASVRRHSMQPEGVRIVSSALGKRAKITGAVLLAMDLAREAEPGVNGGMGAVARPRVVNE
jgi:glucokinase-like ROK family protein